MKDLTYEAKLAILRILTDMVYADHVVHEKEKCYIEDVVRDLGLGTDYAHDLDQLVTLRALAVIRELPAHVKGQIARLMGRMIVVDEDINYNEVKLYNAVCESCGIMKDFNLGDYPDYTLSGPFDEADDIFGAP